MYKQRVVRTRVKGTGYDSEYSAYKNLNEYLLAGWLVHSCHPIGSELEYILYMEEKLNAE